MPDMLLKIEAISYDLRGFFLSHPISGAGVIWNAISFEILVIPAKAGIQFVVDAFPMTCGVDSRFRGNDCTWERPCLENDNSTEFLNLLNLKELTDRGSARGACWQKDVENEGRPDYVLENKRGAEMENDRSDYIDENKRVTCFTCYVYDIQGVNCDS
jgi:hypothetical protein